MDYTRVVLPHEELVFDNTLLSRQVQLTITESPVDTVGQYRDITREVNHLRPTHDAWVRHPVLSHIKGGLIRLAASTAFAAQVVLGIAALMAACCVFGTVPVLASIGLALVSIGLFSCAGVSAHKLKKVIPMSKQQLMATYLAARTQLAAVSEEVRRIDGTYRQAINALALKASEIRTSIAEVGKEGNGLAKTVATATVKQLELVLDDVVRQFEQLTVVHVWTSEQSPELNL